MSDSDTLAGGDHTGRERELTALARRLGIEIRDFALFDRALTHSSLISETDEPAQDYESLEFLGDAVLGLAVADYLFHVLPDRSPGEYSRLRAGLINRRTVGRVGRMLEIASAIRLGRGEEQSGGRQRTALLSDCLEALIGAIYLDGGWAKAQEFVVRVFREELARAEAGGKIWDFKSRLQDYCQAERIALPRFEVVRTEGPDHCKEFEVEVYVRNQALGRGRGTTIKEAEQQAAREALEREGLHLGQDR
jgi:ribonuclease-3